MKFLIVEPSPLPILIPLGPKYSPQDPVFKYPYPAPGTVHKYLGICLVTEEHLGYGGRQSEGCESRHRKDV